MAPLLFIALIENAFKHGVSNTQPSFVHIDISVDDDSHRIICRIENSCFPKGSDDKSGSGIGLDNLKNVSTYYIRDIIRLLLRRMNILIAPN